VAAVAAAASAAAGAAAAVVEVIPTRYRWISTLKPSPDAPPGDKMFLSFSVPTSLLPTTITPPVDAEGDIKMETKQEQEPQAIVPAVCAVDGCTAKRKYRLVRDWERGACGMDHLHILERRSGSGPVAV
jgi:Ino eighty subunit 2